MKERTTRLSVDVCTMICSNLTTLKGESYCVVSRLCPDNTCMTEIYEAISDKEMTLINRMCYTVELEREFYSQHRWVVFECNHSNIKEKVKNREYQKEWEGAIENWNKGDHKLWKN